MCMWMVYIYLVWKKTDLWSYSMRKISPALVGIYSVHQTTTRNAPATSYRQRWLNVSGTTAAAAKVWRAKEYAHAVMSDGRLARRPLRPTPNAASTVTAHTLPFTPSSTAVTAADQHNIIRKLTAAKRKMEIRFPIFRFCRITK